VNVRKKRVVEALGAVVVGVKVELVKIQSYDMLFHHNLSSFFVHRQ